MTDDPIAKAKLQAALFRTHGPGTGTPTEVWMETLGTQFADVKFYQRDGTWTTERHVADPETIATTIDMSAARFGARSAVWFYNGEWLVWLFRAKDEPARPFPNEEAAEMYAIHRG